MAIIRVLSSTLSNLGCLMLLLACTSLALDEVPSSSCENIQPEVQNNGHGTFFDNAKTQLGEDIPKIEDWLEMIEVLSASNKAGYLNTSYHDIRFNETGHFNSSSSSGHWDIHGYALWKVKENTANVSQYNIEKIEVKNMTFLLATYSHVSLIRENNVVTFCLKANARLILENANETNTTLSNIVTIGNGLLNYTSNSTGFFRIKATSTVNTTKNITMLYTQHKNSFEFDDKHAHWVGVINVTQVFPQVPETSILLNKILEERVKLPDTSLNLSKCYSGSQVVEDKHLTITNTASETITTPSNTTKLSIKTSGYVWENLHSFNMNLPDTFNGVLPTFLFSIIFC